MVTTYVRKEKKSKINYLKFYLNELQNIKPRKGGKRLRKMKRNINEVKNELKKKWWGSVRETKSSSLKRSLKCIHI